MTRCRDHRYFVLIPASSCHCVRDWQSVQTYTCCPRVPAFFLRVCVLFGMMLPQAHVMQRHRSHRYVVNSSLELKNCFGFSGTIDFLHLPRLVHVGSRQVMQVSQCGEVHLGLQQSKHKALRLKRWCHIDCVNPEGPFFSSHSEHGC